MNLPTYPAINSSFYNIILLHYSVTGLKIYIHFANKCFKLSQKFNTNLLHNTCLLSIMENV